MTCFVCFPGSLAFSSFRQFRLLNELRKINSNIVEVHAQYLHFVLANETLSSDHKNRISVLLEYGTPFKKIDYSDKTEEKFIVLPRFGTVSPWSSKAIDIVLRCGLSSVFRVERAIEYSIVLNVDISHSKKIFSDDIRAVVSEKLHDRMTESFVNSRKDVKYLLLKKLPKKSLKTVNILQMGRIALERANIELGFFLSVVEIDYLIKVFQSLKRNPTDVELMMFAQVNSEHCRHKIFNAHWTIDNEVQDISLFQMIQNTERLNSKGTIVSYSDNSAIMVGAQANCWFPNARTSQTNNKKERYSYHNELTHTLLKVETHNHPTAISPFFGAATGAGGEIRDEGATGRGARPKAGLSGFTVSNLNFPDLREAWENMRDAAQPMCKRNLDKQYALYGRPRRIASPLSIMIDAPLGSAAFNNEFGRPNLIGYFRVYEQNICGRVFGYHKPIIISGGIGNISDAHVHKLDIPDGSLLIQIGGPGMRIGMGGATASSMEAGSNTAELDFNSVQRGNPEIERRAQEVINRCWHLDDQNPILGIHDVGAGGLSNAFLELIDRADKGGCFELNKIYVEESGLSPLEIWSNEAQERYVLAISPDDLQRFEAICLRERCPFSVVGVATNTREFKLVDNCEKNSDEYLVNMPVDILLGKLPRVHLNVLRTITNPAPSVNLTDISLTDVAIDVLRHPTVSSKSFLITIGDRSIGGMSVRDQMVGPWQTPVADCAITTLDYTGFSGEVIAIAERTPIAVINAPASGRMAVGEVITNISAARIESLDKLKLSANWMAACGTLGEDANLFDTVKAVGMELCPKLGIGIPVGKDSLSMKTKWNDDNDKHIEKEVISPVSLIISAFTSVDCVRHHLTPQLRCITDVGNSVLIAIDLGRGKNRIGGSILAQIIQQVGNTTPDVDDPKDLKNFFVAIQSLNRQDKILAYHDRSDGGLWVSVCEMAFSGHVGISLNVDMLIVDVNYESDYGDSKDWTKQISARLEDKMLRALFSEELGAVIQVRAIDRDSVLKTLRVHGLSACSHVIGTINDRDVIEVFRDAKKIYEATRVDLQRAWDNVSWRIARLRDNPDCADSEHSIISDTTDPGISPILTFDMNEDIAAPFLKKGIRPPVAILREQGINSHSETAHVFYLSGFDVYDIHMTDLLEGRANLKDFTGIVACGGFSYGDVLGAGEGWAKTIRFNDRLFAMFSEFFIRNNTFALGICNGCQMLASLASIIPGADAWPKFTRNKSEQFEARFSSVEIKKSPSIFFDGMEGSKIPVAVAHGEGFADFSQHGDINRVAIAMSYVDHYGLPTECYPLNPNGSPSGITSVTTDDGRFTVLMPHMERVCRTVTMSWHPENWGDVSPWMRAFRNARRWVG
ncbi:MAG: phosphoribosylformylglycinamidine synthase [Burkholderia sp.]|nr:phosphoribosylformylglycinamidine synthase [Burkholderia sp.]